MLHASINALCDVTYSFATVDLAADRWNMARSFWNASKTANITKDYFAAQWDFGDVLQSNIIFVIFAVLDLRVGGCRS